MAFYESDDEDDFKREVDEVLEDYCLEFGSDELFEDIYITQPPAVKAPLHKRFGHLDVFKRPFCLVFTMENQDTKKNELAINEEVLRQISEIDVPISVVGICGVYRTGKSYLMNRLAEEKKGFSLGSTIRSETKGIWAWCRVHPKSPEEVLILLDTEGLSDAEKGDEEHDTQLFCLTMLMSSALIYNMKGVIDQDALKRLSFITQVTKQVSVAGSTFSTEEEDKSTLQLISPHFVFCLRDFFYQLVDNGTITADQYMESCLKESIDKGDTFNSIRGSIKAFFPKRKCFVMSQPAMNKKLQCLEDLAEEELDEDFKNDVQKMITYLHDLSPKCLDKVTRKCWDGTTFESFLRTYIRELSKGEKMEFGSALETAGRYHNGKLVVSIALAFEAQLEKLDLPRPKLELIDIAIEKMHSLLGQFRQSAYPCRVQYFEEKAMKKMKKKMYDLESRNSAEVNKACFKYLSKAHEKMMEDNKERYKKKDGYTKYEEDFDALLKRYKKTFDRYDSKEQHEALEKFKESSNVLEAKYQAKLKSEINKYEEEVQKKFNKLDMEAFMKKEMEKLKKEQEKLLQKEINDYKEKLSALSFGDIGFFKRLKYLLTGKMDVE